MKLTIKNSMMILAACLISLSTSVFAQGKKGKDKEENKEVIMEKKMMNHDDIENYHGEKGGMGIKGLTDDQKQKMKSLKTANQKERMQAKNVLNEKLAHLKTLESADNTDMAAINKTIDEIGILKTEMMKKRASHKQDIRKILNDEQRLQFDLQHNKEGNRGMKNKKMKRMKKEGHGMEMEKEIEIKITKDDDND